MAYQLRTAAKYAAAKSAGWIPALPAKSAIVRGNGLRIHVEAMSSSISASIPYQDKELELIFLCHPLELAVRILQFCRGYSNEEQNRKVHKKALISYLAHYEPFGSFCTQPVKSLILARTAEL